MSDFRHLSSFFLVIFFMFTIKVEASVSVAISASPNNLVPFYSTDANSQNINRLVHLSLIDFDEKMNVICRLCDSFKEVREADKYSIIFKLRSDVKFWDGEKVKITDIKNSVKYFTEEDKIKSNFRFAFANIKEVKSLSDNEVEFVYNQFGLDHLPNLVLLKILKLNNMQPTLENIIGAGEYKYKKVTNDRIEIESIAKKFEDLNFIVVKDETTLSLKLLKGEIDLSIAEMSPRKIEYLENTGKIVVSKNESTNYNYIGINHLREYFKDQRIRKAFALLVPREKIIEFKYKKNAVISSGLYSRAFDSLYVSHDLKYDPAQARKLFMEAGFEYKNGHWFKNNEELKILWKSTNNKFSLEIVEVIKDEFEKFGISVTLVVQEWGTFLKGLKNGEYDFFIGKWVGFTGPDMLKFAFHTSNIPPKGANRGFYSNLELDKLLDRAELIENKEEQNHLYRQASSLVNNDYAYINLWHPSVIWVMKKCISLSYIYPNGNLLALRTIKNECGKR